MKAILFDFDGTLVDSSEGITKSVQYALNYFGIKENDLQKLCRFVGPPLDDSFMRFYGLSNDEALKAVEYYRIRYSKVGLFECDLYPRVKETIVKLREEGYRIGVASSKPEEFCRKILNHFDILDLFDDVVGATFDRTISTKEQVLSEVFRRWSDIPTNEMCLVGDTIYDVNGANQHHIPCVAVSFGFGNMEEMLQAGAAAKCDEFSQLPELISKL